LKALLLSFLLGLPLPAQGLQVTLSGGAETRLWQAVKKSPTPSLLIFEDGAKPMAASVRKLLQEEAVVDLGLAPVTLEPKNNELAAAVRGRLSLAPSVRWAVVDQKERRLASGQALPTADGLAKALAAKGVQSPIRLLREFLKDNPDHLEARMDLSRLQLKSAEQRTRAALGLELSEAEEDPEDMSSAMLRLADPFFGSSKPKPLPADKVLGAEQDIKIWGGYADSFDRLFAGDDWAAGGWTFEAGGAPLEACSPTVKGLYRRKLRQVEAALETAPLNNRLWSVWTRMADVVGDASILAMVDRLVQGPGGGFSAWPAAVRRRLMDEAREKSRWDYIADYLWGAYQDAVTGPKIMFGLGGVDNENVRRVVDDMQTREWETLFEPLLEALLRMGGVGRADAVMNTLREWREKGQWSGAQMQKAVALANRCGRQDVARRWSLFLPVSSGVE
jgi:hypothetical protein